MLGFISLSLPTIFDRIELCHDISCRKFQLSFLIWSLLTGSEMSAFFRKTSDRVLDCAFLHYSGEASKHGLDVDN